MNRFFSFLVLIAFWHGMLSVHASEKRPNVLLILTDNQSYFELSGHGHPHVKTPRIDAFSKEGVDFLNFHAAPFCSPSRASLLTGRYAMRAGIHNTIGGVSILHQNEITIADYLGKNGYQTAVFGKWHLGMSHPYLPQQRGFQEVFVHGGGGIGQLEDYYGNSHLNAVYIHNGKPEKSMGFSTDILFGKAREFIKTNQKNPFFCFISTPATHRPWQPHPEAARRIQDRGEKYAHNDLALYSMIENIDENVGTILDQIDNLNLRENTLVIIATDQGTRRERQHKELAYDEYHQVFCMMRYPPLTGDSSPPSKALTGMIDVAPTILDLCGVNIPGNMDGRSLKPLLSGQSAWKDDRNLIVQCPRGRERTYWKNATVKTQQWRLLEGTKLFHTTKDSKQLSNVADQHPQVVEQLTALYDSFWNSLPPEKQLLSRHLLGAPDALEVKLNAMDWYRGSAPWHQLHMPKFNGNGEWAIELIRDGRYRFELRHPPREAPMPLGAIRARIRIGETTKTIELAENQNHAILDLKLKKGEFDLKTELHPGLDSPRNKPWGALFVYVQYLGQ
ncbi:MAG TPA: hypothetical protein EYG38_15115 [Verrucomicrobia bacterium]|nr:hypothetical protein [Verrucomicrobiota bacterium]